jgi:uncharacterized protein YecE (DUF72 family)
LVIRVGPAGWSYADWRGRVHPTREEPGGHPLARLARTFGCVELNTSFYRDPLEQHQHTWLRVTASCDGLRMPLKLHRRSTHERAARTPRELCAELQSWRAALHPLLDSALAGPVLIQFPFSFQPVPSHVRYLRALLDELDDLSPVVELRRRAWYSPECVAAWRTPNVAACLIDLPEHAEHPRPEDVLACFQEGRTGYLRLHGRNAAAWFDQGAHRDQRYDHLYERAELEPLARLARCLDGSHDETYVVTNNHFSGKAVANAVELLVLLGQAPDAIPALWAEAFPRLAGLVALEGRTELFG